MTFEVWRRVYQPVAKPQWRRRYMAGIMVLSGVRHATLWGSEIWVASARKGSASEIVAGWRAGENLNEVYPDFPLLFKVIDARKRLSVQVHPNENTVALTGGEPKSEMWYALSDGPLYAGMNPGTEVAEVVKAVEDGRFDELLVRHNAKTGEVYSIPGGLVHAIGDEIMLFEVQQSSDTTFRFYDWNRVDADGRPRQLNVEKSLQAADLSLPPPEACSSLDLPFFRFYGMRVDGKAELASDDRFIVGFAADGKVTAGGFQVERHKCFLIPPGVSCALEGAGVTVLVTEIPVW